MKTSALLPKSSAMPVKSTGHSLHSFCIASLIYFPLAAAAFVGIPSFQETFKAAGTPTTMTLSFAQFQGTAPVETSTAEVVPETKPEVKPEPKPEVKPEPKPEPKPEVKPEPKSKPKTIPKPESKPKAQPVAKPKPAPEAVQEPQTEVAEAKPDVTQPPQPVGAQVAAGQSGISTLVFGQSDDPFLAAVRREVQSAVKYPRKARQMRMEGTAMIQFIVNTEGSLNELEIYESSGHALLDKMAIKAVKVAQTKWGQPNREVRLRFPIQFKIRG